MIDLSISIVNWNTKDELNNCLISIFSQDCSYTYNVVVLDNASSDDSINMLESDYPDKIQLIKNVENYGFGKAHNQAIKVSESRYILILNPDCVLLDKDVLSKMIAYMDSNHEIGIIGPKILNPDGSLQFSARHFPNMFAGIFRQTVLGKMFPDNRFVRQYLMTDFPHDQIFDVDWLSGSAMFVRKKMIEEIGMLDERFFMYCEDVDLCKRAHLANWRVVYYPEVKITHRIGAASDKNAVGMVKQHHKSMYKYFLKYNSKSPRILLAPLVLIALKIRMGSLLKKTH
jgi:GT2 family glycosyltransferase